MNFLKNLQRNLWGLTKIAGLEVRILPDGKVMAYGVILELKGEILQISERIDGLPLAEIKTKINPDIPVVLAFSGKGILGKMLQVASGSDAELVNKIIPNASPDDFYIQRTHLKNGSYFSLIRKENLEEYLLQVKEQGLLCIEASLLGLAIKNLMPVLLSPTLTHYRFGQHEFILEGEEVVDYKYIRDAGEDSKGNLKIGEDNLPKSLVLGYALCFQQLANLEPVKAGIDPIEGKKKEYTQKKIFKALSVGLLGFFFVLLLVNYFIFSNLNDKNNNNAYEASRNKALLAKRDSLRSRTAEMEKFLSNAGWQTASKVSFFADEIGASVPKNVKLSKLEINPKDKSSLERAKKTSFKNGEILLEGECQSATVINPWLNKLKAFNWTKEVQVVNYQFDKREGKGVFSIVIKWI